MKICYLFFIVGTGTFGKVRLCKFNPTNEYYCLKSLNKEKIVQLKQQEHVKNEKAILSSVDHPFIVKLYVIINFQYYLCKPIYSLYSFFIYLKIKYFTITNYNTFCYGICMWW